jgi:hypothetical protein
MPRPMQDVPMLMDKLAAGVKHAARAGGED